jgi:hypothetical protein
MPNDDIVTKALNAPHSTAGPSGAAKAIAESKKVMEGWKSGPLGTKSGHLEGPKSKAPVAAPADLSQTPYSIAHDVRKVTPSPTDIDGVNERMKNTQEYDKANPGAPLNPK